MKKVETIYRNTRHMSPRRGRGVASLVLLAALALFASACIGGGNAEKIPPEILVRYPDVSTTDIPVSAAVTITFNEAMKGISDTTVSLRRLSAAVDVPADITYDAPSFTATLAPRDDLEPDSYYTVTLAITVRDSAGNRMVGAPVSWVFTTGALNDTENPEIIQRSPYTGEQNVATDKTITVKFSELVNYVSGTTIALSETASGTPVTGTVTYSAQIATFVPDAVLAEGTQYTLSCTGGTGGIRDASENPLVSSEWAFKTEDTTAPTIVSINPLENAIDVPPNVEVQVTMSESITNATNSTVSIVEVGTGIDYTGRVEYDDLSKTITLKASGAGLQYLQEYRVTIEGGTGDSVMDTSFNVFAADRIWTFTTSSAPDEESPLVSAVTPLEGAGNITPSTDITIEFNEDVSGVTTSSVILKKNSDDSTVATSIAYTSGTQTAVVDPGSDLEEGEAYTVSCTDTIKDGAGNALVPKTWTFTIADETAPSLTSRTPDAGAIGVKKNGRVIVYFSEDVTGVNGTTFYLKDSLDADVTAVVTYDSDLNRAILTPQDYLDDFGTYTVYLTSGITDTSVNGNALVAMDWEFTTEDTTDITPPEISSSNPSGGDTDVALNAQPSITFDESVIGVSNTTFKLKDGADIVSGLVSFDAATKTATYYSDQDLKGGTVYTIEVTAGIQDLSDPPNVFVADSWTFTTEPDLAAPEFLNPSPANGESGVLIDTSIVGQFNEHVNGVDATTFVVEDDQGTPFDAADVNISYDENTNVVIWSLKDSVLQRGTGTTYTVTITSGITDDAGNTFVETSWSFTTEPDTTPPTIMSGSETPRDTSTGISISSDIAISFSEDMDLSSLNTDSFYIEETLSGTKKIDVIYSFDVNSKMAIMSLDTDLDPTLGYTVTVKSGTTGVKDLGQNSIASDYVWTFTSGQIPDTTAPTVDTVAPADASIDVALNLASITALFSEEVQNVNSSTFQLKAGGIAVPSSISYDNATKTATLSPTYNLIEGTTYTVELKTSIIDMANNPLGSLYSWTFETGGADTINPVIISKSPEGAGAQVRPTISVVFSESVTGISTSTLTLSQSGSQVTEVDVFYDDSTKTATLIPRDPLGTTECTVTLTGGIEDLAGNTLIATPFNFTPVSSPQIFSTSPSDGATGTSVGIATVTINFNRDMDPTTGTAVLSGGSGYFGTPTWTDSDTIEYPVIGPLSAGTTYTVTFESWWESFKDTDGNELNSTPVVAGTLTFTTGSDGGAPSIFSTVPVDGAVNVGVDIPVIVVNFDEPMTASGSLAGTGISAGTGVWSNDNKTVVFPMTGSLSAGSRTATLSGFTDAAGNALSGNTFSFTASSVTGFVVISEATDSFETYSEPDFTSYTNASGGWAQAIKANNPTATPSDGSHMALGPALSWNSGDAGYLEQRSAADFSSAGSYMLSLKMAHDGDSPAADYLNISVSTDEGSSYASLGQPVYRYIYGFTPVYVVHSGSGLDNFDPVEYRMTSGRVRILAGDTVVSGINSGDYFVDASNAWFVISSIVEDNGTYDEIYIPRWQSVNLGAGAKIMTLSSWTTSYFDLSSYAGESSVLIRLEAVSAGDSGGNIIIDDVQMRRY